MVSHHCRILRSRRRAAGDTTWSGRDPVLIRSDECLSQASMPLVSKRAVAGVILLFANAGMSRAMASHSTLQESSLRCALNRAVGTRNEVHFERLLASGVSKVFLRGLNSSSSSSTISFTEVRKGFDERLLSQPQPISDVFAPYASEQIS